MKSHTLPIVRLLPFSDALKRERPYLSCAGSMTSAAPVFINSGLNLVGWMHRLKELEDENCRLKKMYAEERLEAEIIQEAMQKSGKAISAQADSKSSSEKQAYQYSFCLSDIFSQ